jgi:hypothetical protein
MTDSQHQTPSTPTSLARLARLAFAGGDLGVPWQQALARVGADAGDAAAVMDLSTIALLGGRREEGLGLQAHALERARHYRLPAASPGPRTLRLLAFVAPGDFMANTPLEFLLEDADVTLDKLYLTPGAPPQEVPEHDLAIVAVGESDVNRPLLDALAPLVRGWPRPVLNRPEQIAGLAREHAWRALQPIEGVEMPVTVRAARDALARVADGAAPLATALPGGVFPVIARPIASHAGDGLAKLDDAAALAAYLAGRTEDEFYLARFVDYRSPDGRFRKYRVALIDGCPFLCHMAISSHWMVHYLNAGMTEDAEKRAEEARVMAGFERGFAARHAAALAAIAEQLGLEYVALDCGESADGRLLVFEADVAMIVHAMDPPDLFPYKGPQMKRLFEAFVGALRAHAGRPLSDAA